MMARRNPVKAPRNASVMERLLNVRNPWLVKMNPVYAIATVQRITRTGNMGNHLLMSTYCHNSPLRSEGGVVEFSHRRPLSRSIKCEGRRQEDRLRPLFSTVREQMPVLSSLYLNTDTF
jgi:hypothetical protein